MPFQVSKAAMTSNQWGDGVILVGGWNFLIEESSDVMLELKVGNYKYWNVMKKKLAVGRHHHLAFPISPILSKCGMNMLIFIL